MSSSYVSGNPAAGEDVMPQERLNLLDDPVSDRVWRQLAHSVRLDQLGAHPVQWLSPGRHPDPQIGVTRVVWEGETPWTADAPLRDIADEDQRSTLGVARSWLRQALANGPRPARGAPSRSAGYRRQAIGIAFRTYQAARKAEGIVTRKEQSLHGPWLLALPTPPDQ